MSVSLRAAAHAMQHAGTNSRAQVIAVYRNIVRTARALPSHNHRGLVLQRARSSFRSNAGLAGDEAVAALQLAHTQLDNLQHQLRHMQEIMHDTNTLTHDAPKPAAMYAATPAASSSSSAVPAAPFGSRSFSTARRILAAAAAAPAAAPSAASPVAPAAVAAAAAAAGSTPVPSWMTQSATPGSTPGAATEGSAAAGAFVVPAPPSGPVVATHIVHVRLTHNNTICTLTTLDGAIACWTSSGSVGFKNSKKSTYMACIAAGEQLGLKAKQLLVSKVDMHIAGFHKNKKAVLKGVVKAGLTVVAIRDTTPIPFNGCKPKKQRRL